MAHLAVIIDEVPAYRSGISHILERLGLDVLDLEESQLPRSEMAADVFVISISDARGRGLIRQIRDNHVDTPIVAIVPPSVDGALLQAAVLTDGAIAAVARDAPRDLIASTVGAALSDWSVLVVPGEGIRAFQSLFAKALPDATDQITEQELAMLNLLFRGVSRRAIARKLHYAPRTIDRHIQVAYRKLNATTKTDAIVRALLWGYLTSPSTEE